MRSVKVIEIHSGNSLFECEIEDVEKAYKYAAEMEEMGLDVKIDAPSLPQTLIESLGAKQDDVDTLKSEINDELDSHNQPSCK